MTVSTLAGPLPAVSHAVTAFAAQHGVLEYLPAVWAMTQRIFQPAPVTVLLEEDPEIANDCHIVFEIDVAGMQEDHLFAAQTEWSQEIFKHCPPTHAYIFRYGLVMIA